MVWCSNFVRGRSCCGYCNKIAFDLVETCSPTPGPRSARRRQAAKRKTRAIPTMIKIRLSPAIKCSATPIFAHVPTIQYMLSCKVLQRVIKHDKLD